MTMNTTEAKEFASVIAAAITETQKAQPLDMGKLVTVGSTSDPEIDRKVLCNGCLRGQPFLPNERPVRDLGTGGIVRDERGNVLREDGGVIYPQRSDGTPTGERKPVTHLISYDEVAATKLAAKGAVKQCISCGQERDKAVMYDGRRA